MNESELPSSIILLTGIVEQLILMNKRLSENQRKLEAIEQELILIRRAADRR